MTFLRISCVPLRAASSKAFARFANLKITTRGAISDPPRRENFSAHLTFAILVSRPRRSYYPELRYSLGATRKIDSVTIARIRFSWFGWMRGAKHFHRKLGGR